MGKKKEVKFITNGLAAVEAPPADENPALVYVASLSAGSRRTMRQALDTIAWIASHGQASALTLPWSALRFQHTTAIRARLEEAYAASTANKMLAALRGTLKQAWLLGQMTAEEYHQAVAVENVEGKRLAAGRDIQAGELAALMAVCGADESKSGARDAAIVGVLYTCGLRREELVKLNLADYDLEAGALHVNGKRNKDRLTYPASGAIEALADWLEVRGRRPGPLFYPIRKGGKIERRRMTPQAVWKRMKYRAKQAEVRDLSAHDFRRTFVGDLLEAGADIATVQKLAGHANVNTTARYDRRPEEVKRRAAGLLHLPYRRRGSR